MIPSERDLLLAACHFGHPKNKWNPKIAPYVYGVRKGVHIFDLIKTREQLGKVCEELRALQKAGKTILFASTKQQSTDLVETLCKSLKQPFVTKKWIPGLLTNWDTVKRRIQHYLDLQQSFRTGEVEKYTKKEQTKLRKDLEKLHNAYHGVAQMKKPPDALFVVDAVRDLVAVREARKLNIPVFGICDTNADPDNFTVCIPANDDAVRSIEIILRTIEEELGGSAPKKESSVEEKEEASV